ncbi:NTP transferase domain-containing protein [Pelagibacteraceae bacterium]|nr:NTP transferase domain-containing protein [Pelagibacteraceae bacterium]
MKNKISCLIPAAGKGSRTGLTYPKTLYKINSLPIIVRILKNINHLDAKPTIIINNKFLFLFRSTLNNYKFSAEFIQQRYPRGMGNAIIQFIKSKKFIKTNHILLIWGDVPFLRKTSLDKLINFHLKNNNDFSLITKFVKDPYTIVNRNSSGKIVSVIETKLFPKKKIKYGEREIGVFIFKKNLIINLLKKNLSKKYYKKEHGFLYLIKHLVNLGYKVEALPIANNKEIISFNSINDLK